MEMDLSNRIKEEDFKGKKIVSIDFSTLMTEKFMQMIEISENYISDKEDLLIVFDITKATIFGEVLDASKKFARKLGTHRKKSAFLGIVGAKKILLKSILFFSGAHASKIKVCDTKEEALEWLVAE